MNGLDGFERLLTEFGQSIGIPDLCFDADGLCHIRIDEEYPITFRRDDENHCLVLVGLLAEALPEKLDRELVLDMLATGVEPLRDHGSAIGIEPQSGTVILHRTMPLAKIDKAALEQMLGGFIVMQKDWSLRLNGAKPASGTPAMPDAPPRTVAQPPAERAADRRAGPPRFHHQG